MKHLAAAALALIALLTTGAQAEQRVYYDSAGRVVGRSDTGSNGAVTHYGPDGRAVTRESPTSGGSTVYDARTGKAIGKATGKSR